MFYLIYLAIAMITAVIIAHKIKTIDTEDIHDCIILGCASMLWPIILFIVIIYYLIKLFKK